MSMNTYPVIVRSALIIDDRLASLIGETYDNPTPDSGELIDYMSDDGILGIYGRYVSNFTGSFNYLHPTNNVEYIDCEEDVIIWLEPKCEPLFYKAAYANEDELISEYRDTLNKYYNIPADFDLKPYLVNIYGTFYC